MRAPSATMARPTARVSCRSPSSTIPTTRRGHGGPTDGTKIGQIVRFLRASAAVPTPSPRPHDGAREPPPGVFPTPTRLPKFGHDPLVKLSTAVSNPQSPTGRRIAQGFKAGGFRCLRPGLHLHHNSLSLAPAGVTEGFDDPSLAKHHNQPGQTGLCRRVEDELHGATFPWTILGNRARRYLFQPSQGPQRSVWGSSC